MKQDPHATKFELVCCSALRAEVTALRHAGWPEHTITFLHSTMHLHPERLAAALQPVLEKGLKQGHTVVLIYGDCCARMTAWESMPGVVRTQGKNCCELLLGADEYRRLSHAGAFFVIPKWARHWKRFFRGLGLDRNNASSLMQELHRSLVYLDTGLSPVPEKALQACADYCGLPYEVRPVSLDALRSAVENALYGNAATLS